MPVVLSAPLKTVYIKNREAVPEGLDEDSIFAEARAKAKATAAEPTPLAKSSTAAQAPVAGADPSAVAHQVPQQLIKMAATVPPGMAGGMQLRVQTPAGLMQVSIPTGLQAGMTFEMWVPSGSPPPPQPAPIAPLPAAPYMPSHQKMQVAVPQGMSGGMPLRVQCPGSVGCGLVQVTIPAGLSGGMYFEIMVPSPPAAVNGVALPAVYPGLHPQTTGPQGYNYPLQVQQGQPVMQGQTLPLGNVMQMGQPMGQPMMQMGQPGQVGSAPPPQYAPFFRPY